MEHPRKKLTSFLQADLIQPETALAVSFLMPVTAYLIMFVMRGISPFGDATIFGSDLHHQYGPFFAEFRHKLLTGGSLFYTWNMGLGMNFWSLVPYYLSSPLNLLTVFVPQSCLVELMTVLIVVKIGLCSLSMTWYLRNRCKSYDFGAALFGICYGMSGFVTAYHWNLMWLDAVIYFPLVLRGLERLVWEGNCRFYLLFLTLSILSNYYISIMTCLFLVLYFPFLLFLKSEKGRKDGESRAALRAFWQFSFCSLLAGGMAAVLLIPELLALRTAYAGEFGVPELFHLYFSPFQVLARHLANVKAEYELAHWPNLYCGVAVFLLIPLYGSCGHIDRRERMGMLSLAVFLLLSFCFEGLDYLWHGFHFPNCFPARESYIYIFLVLFMSYRAYQQLPRIPAGRTAAVCLAALAAVILAWKFPVEKYFRARSYWLSALYLILYTVCILAVQRKGERKETKLPDEGKLCHRALVLVFGLVAVETLFTVTDNGMFGFSRAAYTQYDEESEKTVKCLKREAEDDFFRMKKTPMDKANDGAWLHYPSAAAFSSVNYYGPAKVLHRLGCEAHPNYYTSQGGTPLVDMLLGISWDLSFEEKPETSYRRLKEDVKEVCLYELPEAFPLGFQTEAAGLEISEGELPLPVRVQNGLAASCGVEPVLILSEGTEQRAEEIVFTPEKDGEYYAYFENPDLNRLEAEFSWGTRKYETWTPGCFIELGWCGAGEPIRITAERKEPLHASVYRFDGNGLREIRENLVKSSWKLDVWTDTVLEGTIDCPEGGAMMTTIPYDSGWRVWVDGKREETEAALDAFLSVPLTAGVHRIRMQYTPPGFWLGAGISLVSLLAALFANRIKDK